MNVIDCRIELVQVEGRYRKEMGDITKLARSIERLGLLQPIGIDSAYRLVFGERRLRAYQYLGRETIPARFINLDSNIEGEYDENEEREPFTTSERVAIGEAKERQLAGRKGQRTDIQLPENFPEVPKGETRDLAAKAAGFGNGKTYEQDVDFGACLVRAMRWKGAWVPQHHKQITCRKAVERLLAYSENMQRAHLRVVQGGKA